MKRTNLFHMDRLIKTLLDDFSAVISAADISLEIKLKENPHFMDDQDKIRRLLINILDNAIKYNYEGGIIELQALPLQHRPGQPG